jgi:7-cyano-7-deazaguanine synthase in queuosine biosynthesis
MLKSLAGVSRLYDVSNSKPIVNILWTGGWDSTYRIVTLSEKDVIIQPYYLSDNRKSEKNELNAIENICNELRKRSTTNCIIEELKISKTSDIQKDKETSEAFNNIVRKMFMGSQYDWLARFAKAHEGLELCIHQDDKACDVINTYGQVKVIDDDEIGKYFVLNELESSKELFQVFGSFRFPLLTLSKLDMKQEAENRGYADIMDMTWFCHNPINNEPCGICNPCIYTIEEGMAYRISEQALKRYNIEKKYGNLNWYRYVKAIRRRIIG